MVGACTHSMASSPPLSAAKKLRCSFVCLGSLTLCWVIAQLVLKLPGGSSTSKGAAEPLSMDIAKMFEVLPSDVGLLFDARAGQGYCGDATLDVCKNLRSHNLKRVIQNYAWRDYGKAASVLRAVWPSYQEIEDAPKAAASDNSLGLTWSMAVQRVARCCGSRPCYVSIKIDMTGIEPVLVKSLLSTIGDCGVELTLKALGLKELPYGTPQDWKRVQTSGNRQRLCTFYLLKYRGLRILVTCDPLPSKRVRTGSMTNHGGNRQ